MPTVLELTNEIRSSFTEDQITLLELELIVCKLAKITRAQLKSRPERVIQKDIAELIKIYCQGRSQGEPIAYLFHEREFWSMSLYVDENVLIPRHETELIIEYCIKHYPKTKDLQCLELGTGSGAIALALAKEFPDWQITATDKSEQALSVASRNAKQHNISSINFVLSDWFESLNNFEYDLIISNPPYIAENDPHLTQGDLRFEPVSALAADEQGYADLYKIIEDSKHYLSQNGEIILEHGYEQGPTLIKYLSEAGYNSIKTHQDLSLLDRYTTARLNR